MKTILDLSDVIFYLLLGKSKLKMAYCWPDAGHAEVLLLGLHLASRGRGGKIMWMKMLQIPR